MTINVTIHGELLDDRLILSLREVCEICQSREDSIVELVREGIVEPVGQAESAWQFTGASVTRIQTVLRLQRDLEINLPGAALALELLEEVQQLRRRLGD